MTTASPPSPQQTDPATESNEPAALPEPNPKPAVAWFDWYCLLFWLAGAAILFGLHVLDGLYRLIRFP